MINQNKIEMYCVTNKRLKFLENFTYNLSWVGKKKSPDNYLKCDSMDNIFFKEKYYSELTFHYWYWKNILDINKDNWVGFCQKRRFWSKHKIQEKKIFNNLVEEYKNNKNIFFNGVELFLIE